MLFAVFHTLYYDSKPCTLVLHTKEIIAMNTYDKSIGYKCTYKLVPTNAPFRVLPNFRTIRDEDLIGPYDVSTIKAIVD